MSTEINKSQQTITTQQESVITILLSGQTQTTAAAEVGVAKETISRWLASDAQFVAVLNSRRRELWNANLDWLQSLGDEAVATIGGLMNSHNETIQLKASMAVLAMVRGEAGHIGSADPEQVKLNWAQESPSDIDRMCAGLL